MLKHGAATVNNNTLGIPVDVNGTDSSCTVGTSHPTPCCFIWHFDTLVGEVVSASKKRQNRSYRSVACHLIDRVSCSNQQVTSRPVALVWLMRIAVETAIVWTFEEVNLFAAYWLETTRVHLKALQDQ